MNPFDMGAFGPLLAGFQQKLEDMKRKASSTEVSGTAGGGLVTVVATCDNQIVSVRIAPEAAEDRELLEDLVRAATNEALRKAKDEMANAMSQLTGGLPIPPGFLPGF